VEVIALGPPLPTTGSIPMDNDNDDAADEEAAARRRRRRRRQSAGVVATMRMTGAAVLARLQTSFKVGG
jgi:hypothetical protein